MPQQRPPARLLPPLAAAALGALALAGCIPGNRPDPAPAPALDPASPPPAPESAAPDIPPQPPVEVPSAAAPPPFKITAVVPNARESAAGTYKVIAGDTLRRISDRTGAGSEAIARANGLVPPFTIKAGQTLRIPAGRWHRVAAGETGIAIARAYGVEWSRIVAANGLEEPYILRTGQRLMLPSAAEVAAMSVEARAAAFQLDIGDIISGGEPALVAGARPVKPRPAAPGAAPLPPTSAVAAASRFDGRFAWPLTGPILTRFGPYGSGRRSDGINIAVAMDTPIRAAADGVVLYAGTDIAVYGGLILIRHSDKWTTAYGHAGELLVARGQAVKKGQVIARAGESGSAETPQLHFEIRQGRKPVDPVQYLPRRG
ncbi:M23 family metallopeptidase [Sphingomonas profundi]|uniref:M23 family metallopeptidase n=1 Tax=Alterirhizorhabdus profundi TaxID=2681549 RepID=UPI0012E948C7|nr:M23 family metallopeptidase [Sphingomonas profundi]